MSMYRKAQGNVGEQLIARYLEKKGYTVIARNYQTRSGEIDLIAQKDDTIAFIEVKWRKNDEIDPTTVISYSKQKKIIATARHFIAHNDNDEIIYRFDVGIVCAKNDTPYISYISNAFMPYE